jgi:hypothetical protein
MFCSFFCSRGPDGCPPGRALCAPSALHKSLASTSPFRKLRIAESEYGLQNFTESGYGFRIYGIEVDMYGVSRGAIFRFFFGNRRFDTYARIPRIHGFRADSAKNGAPLPHAAAAPSQSELEGNRIVRKATKQGPAPQAPKYLGRASHQRRRVPCAVRPCGYYELGK